ncbi:MAG: cobalt transporter CbiM [Candidatus Tectomicrobia bacterium]|uniref:Cobalt transporter CbiM n=1 Tax=Tectimicrobiota bacterium TaxID=2528274 RepID=A0A932CRC8_UNCTE|nr:cobalt transporter CbiM [Candidatus Tectomicrobia bacterium]
MHIPDGYLGPITYGSLWAAMAPIWMVASKRVQRTLRASQIPLLAMASAFSFTMMILRVPLPGGTTGHITGTTLVALLLGPWAAAIAVSMALIIQALFFGDGGVTAIGANCFNIGFAEAMAGYGIYALIGGRGRKAYPAGPEDREVQRSPLTARHAVGAALGAYLAVNLGGLLTAVELGLQPLLHVSESGAPLYSPFPVAVTLPAIMGPHLTLIGALEAAITVLVLLFLAKSHPELIQTRS